MASSGLWSGLAKAECHRLGAERLAAALHAQQQQPAWYGEPELARLLREGPAAFSEPALELAEAAHLPQARDGLVEGQGGGAPQRASLVAHDLRHRVGVEPAGRAAGPAEDAHGLAGGEPLSAAHRVVELRRTTAWRRSESAGSRSRRRRTASGSPRWRWASSSTKSAGSAKAARAARPWSSEPLPWPDSPRPRATDHGTSFQLPLFATRSRTWSARSSSKVSKATIRQPERSSSRSSSLQLLLTLRPP